MFSESIGSKGGGAPTSTEHTIYRLDTSVYTIFSYLSRGILDGYIYQKTLGKHQAFLSGVYSFTKVTICSNVRGCF